MYNISSLRGLTLKYMYFIVDTSIILLYDYIFYSKGGCEKISRPLQELKIGSGVIAIGYLAGS